MCVIPLKSDCDLYHWPFATGGLIVANVAAAYTTGLGEGPLTDSWKLQFGEGLHPLQWLTCNFVHFGLFHLLGNMLFLWVFGLGVEGRIGWWRFLLLYLGIGVAGGLIGQVWMADHSGIVSGAGGASLAIFGIMAVALLWHPFADIECLCVFVVWGRPAVAERVPIGVFWFAGFHIIKEFCFSSWVAGPFRGEPTSAAFHALGAALGAAAGYFMLKRNLVDCEGQDIFNVGKTSSYFDQFRKPGQQPRLHGEVADESPGDRPETRRGRPDRLIAGHVEHENWGDAFGLFVRLTSRQQRTLPETVVRHLGDGLYRAERHDDAADVYVSLLERGGEVSAVVRLKLAAVLLGVRNQPRAALGIVEDLPCDELSDSQRRKRDQILARSKQLIASGHIELSAR